MTLVDDRHHTYEGAGPEPVRRRSPLVRGLLWTLGVLGTVIVLVLAFVLFVVGTGPGTRWALGKGLGMSPVPVTVAGIDGTLLGPLTLEGVTVDFRGVETRVDRVVLDWRPLALLGRRVHVDSLFVDGVDVTVPAELEPAPVPAEPVEPRVGPPAVPELPVEIQVDTFRVGVERVAVADRASLGPSSLGGSGGVEAFVVQASLQGAAPQVEAFQATATLEGAPDAWELAADASMSPVDLPPVTARLASAGTLSDLEVREALVRTAEGEARMTGAAAWYPEVTWDIVADAADLQVAPFAPEPEAWPGSVSFRLATQGALRESGVEASALLEDLGGTLRDEPLSGGMDVRVAGEAVEVRELGVTWGGLEVGAEGALLETLDLRFTLDVPDLGLALPGAAGTIHVDGSATGPRTEPHLVARLEAAGIARDSLRVEALDGDVDVDLAPGASSRIDLRVLGLMSGATAVDSVVAAGEGVREDHRLGVRGWMGPNRMGMGVSGGVEGPPEGGAAALVWAGRLDSLNLVTEAAGDWALAEASPILAGADSASLAESCLVQDAARVCVGGYWQAAGAAGGEARIEALPLSLLAASLPEGVGIDGQVDGEARGAMAAGGTLTADGAFTVTGEIRATTVADDTLHFDLGGDGLTFGVDDAGARADGSFALTPRGGSGDFQASLEVLLPGLTAVPVVPEEQDLTGAIHVESQDLSILAAFSPLVYDAGGRMNLDADITGTLAAPSIQGGLDVEEALADIPDLGLELRDMTLRAEGRPDGAIVLDGSVSSGEGRLQITGQTPALPSTDDPAELELSGERFLAMNTPEIQVEIAPDFQVTFDGELTTVRGSLAVPWARVELVEVPPAAVRPSDDVVFVGEEATPLPLVDARIQVEVGDDVHFDGMGFVSNIAGDVEIVQAPGEDPVLQGEFRIIDGRFAAYGQNLDVEPGRVILAGGPLDAALDVTAERLAQDGTRAGVVVTGPVLNPTIRLISDPALSDADALSYIMYGRSLSEGDPSQQEQVVGAAANLGANVLTTRLAGSVGLDEARIEGTSRETAELVAGKYLSPSVFVAYGRGLFEPTNTFRIKYLLSSSWALQAESGNATGGDVLYQIERGR